MRAFAFFAACAVLSFAPLAMAADPHPTTNDSDFDVTFNQEVDGNAILLVAPPRAQIGAADVILCNTGGQAGRYSVVADANGNPIQPMTVPNGACVTMSNVSYLAVYRSANNASATWQARVMIRLNRTGAGVTRR